MNVERETLIRQYAGGEIIWSLLRQKGFDNYRRVLAGLGALGLRPPIAPMEGPNVASGQRGRAVIREALKATSWRGAPASSSQTPARPACFSPVSSGL